MPRYARIESGIVREIFNLKPVLTPELMAQLVKVPNGLNVEMGWSFDGTLFHEPNEPQLPFESLIRQMFNELPLAQQIKFQDDIMRAAFFLERGNVPLVRTIIDGAAERVELPAEQSVQRIIDAARESLAET